MTLRSLTGGAAEPRFVLHYLEKDQKKRGRPKPPPPRHPATRPQQGKSMLFLVCGAPGDLLPHANLLLTVATSTAFVSWRGLKAYRP